MYSSEIDNVMRERSFNLDSETYSRICSTSPQITRVKYDTFENVFDMWTNDNCSWRFHVYPTLRLG